MLNIDLNNNGVSHEEKQNKMKLKTTKKQIRENTRGNLYSVGYCELQYLLRDENPFAYSSGVNGWACDYYQLSVNGQRVIISTGYSPIGKRIDYKTVREYDTVASKLTAFNSGLNYEQAKEERKKLLNNFLRTLIEEK
ncbi:MAG TPA: hypothetical protein DHV22_04445 [Xanthomarina gelatinilytica]|uniref:Uncharacterized protein n=1 Tax=Xanthomarina gelatinilytica TaxID=1137281 RepID=A0A3D6BS74_9FLAO|nr:hypothetical protein [Xanthomarina gelatinilytica]